MSACRLNFKRCRRLFQRLARGSKEAKAVEVLSINLASLDYIAYSLRTYSYKEQKPVVWNK